MLVLLGALKEEIAGLRRQTIIEETSAENNCRIYKGKYRNKDILLGQTGIGRENAERAASYILERYPVTMLISLGFAGALVGDLRIGDIILGGTLYCGDDKTRESPGINNPIYSDANLVSIALEAKQAKSNRFFQLSSVTVAKPIGNPVGKMVLGETYHAEAVDMESYWIGRIALASGIPFLRIRAISDTLKDILPPFDRFMISGNWQWKKVILYFLTHPRELIRLFQLYRNAGKAGRNLTAFMSSFITRYETS